jgi:hypothetical protein
VNRWSPTLYITATIVHPRAHYWDPKQKRYGDGPLESQLFYQIAGRPRRDVRRQPPERESQQ